MISYLSCVYVYEPVCTRPYLELESKYSQERGWFGYIFYPDVLSHSSLSPLSSATPQHQIHPTQHPLLRPAMPPSRPPTTLSRPHPTIWQITLTSPPDNRLTPSFLHSLAQNLDTIESEWRLSSGTRDEQGPMSDPKTWGEGKGAGAVVITGEGKFWSNGLDYGSATLNKRFFEGGFYTRVDGEEVYISERGDSGSARGGDGGGRWKW